jgi:uncharacterized membrane protein
MSWRVGEDRGVSGSYGTDEEEARITRVVAKRAIRRLDIFEWVLIGGALLLAVLGGWVVAVVLSATLELPLRPTWIGGSLLLFGVPGAMTIRRIRREDREWNRSKESDEADG